MKLTSRVLIVAAFSFLAINLRAASEIVIAIRYLQAEGTSHSHIYLYREDGKFLRQLTGDNSGQDVDPVFAPDGETIVFSREKEGSPVEFWSVRPLGGQSTKLDSAPDWYEQVKTSPYFTNRDKSTESAAPAPESAQTSPLASAAGMIGEADLQGARWLGGINFARRSKRSGRSSERRTARQTLRVALFKNRDPGGFRNFAWLLRRL